MKTMTSRILALIVALCVMMMPVALAEQNTYALTVGNIELTLDGQSVTLPVYLTLGLGADAERGMAWIDLATADQSAATGYAAFENGEIKLYLDGMSYGFTVTIEELIALFEAEMGMSVEDMLTMIMSELPEEFMADLTELLESTSVMADAPELDPEVLLSALNITITENGAEEVEVLGETITAQSVSFSMEDMKLSEIISALCAADADFAAYWADYAAVLNASLEAEAAEMTLDEAMELVSVGFDGTVSSDDTYAKIDLTLSISAEGETIDLPLTIDTAVTETGSISLISSVLDVEGDVLAMEIYFDENEDETGSDGSFSFFMEIADTETGESEGGLSFSGSYADGTDGVALAMGFEYADAYDSAALSFSYIGAPVVSENGIDSYAGILSIAMNDGYSDASINLETNLTVSSLPEGELLSLSDSVSLLSMTEEQLIQLETDLQTVLIQAMGTLMQDPALAPLISELMGGEF